MWRQIAEDIELDIETGRLTPGRQLPTETALAAQYGVNRHTLRRAIGELTAEGFGRSDSRSWNVRACITPRLSDWPVDAVF